ncbi:MAG: hypothetical protein R3E58_15600 [Phycisphaerae bacterium]
MASTLASDIRDGNLRKFIVQPLNYVIYHLHLRMAYKSVYCDGCAYLMRRGVLLVSRVFFPVGRLAGFGRFAFFRWCFRFFSVS